MAGQRGEGEGEGDNCEKGMDACQGRRAGQCREQGVYKPCHRLIGAEVPKTQQRDFSATRQGKTKQGRAMLCGAGGQGKAWQGRQAAQYLASKALGAVPNGVLVPTSPAANWSMLVLPTKMAPARAKSAFDANVLCKIGLACYGLRHGSVRMMLL